MSIKGFSSAILETSMQWHLFKTDGRLRIVWLFLLFRRRSNALLSYESLLKRCWKSIYLDKTLQSEDLGYFNRAR